MEENERLLHWFYKISYRKIPDYQMKREKSLTLSSWKASIENIVLENERLLKRLKNVESSCGEKALHSHWSFYNLVKSKRKKDNLNILI